MWEKKFDNNVQRFERRFELCGFYDENQLPHGGPKPEDRKRREEDDLAFLDCEGSLCPRYDKTNPVRGIQQIIQRFRQVGSTICLHMQTSTSQTSHPFQQMVLSIDWKTQPRVRYKMMSAFLAELLHSFVHK